MPCTEADNGQHLDLVVHTLESIGQVNSEVSALQLGPMAWGLMSDQHRLACIRRIFAKLFENQPFFLTDFLDSHPIMTAKELVALNHRVRWAVGCMQADRPAWTVPAGYVIQLILPWLYDKHLFSPSALR